MAERKEEHWAILYASGRIKPYASAPVNEAHAKKMFFELLDIIYRDHLSAGSDWDKPVALLINGDRMTLPSELGDYAWRYGKWVSDNCADVVKGAQSTYMPERWRS